jgi:AraC family transcriptional regulator
MPGHESPHDKIFARPPHFTVRYRRGRKLRWAFEAATDYAVLVPLEGSFRWSGADSSEGAKSGEVEAGGALLLAPNDPTEAIGTGPASCLTLALSPVFVLDCATRAGLVRAGAFVAFREHAVNSDERLARLARDLADELLGEEAGGQVVVGALVEQTLVHLLRRYGAAVRADRMELSRAGLIDRRVRRAVELMQAHLDRELPLEEIAASAHLSPFHFSRLFKKLTGATPHAYLAALRAARAQALLAETDLSITEIGSRVGYASPSHFSRAFRQATGTTPRAFRQALVRR